MSQTVQIKGIRDGLLVLLGEGEWNLVRENFFEQVDQQIDFFQGARLALDVGNHKIKAADMGKLRDDLSEREITLWAVISNSPTTEKTAQSLGLATRTSKPRPDRSTHPMDTTIYGGEEAILVQRTLRSGFKLQYPGHVVIIGDVNPGAEIIAGGDVIVWGRLRGTVHAGADGDEDAVVCALELDPTQVRISGQIAITPKRRGKAQPEKARIQDGQVVAEQWSPKRR